LNGPRAALVPFFRSIDFTTMRTPALVVAGDKDDSRHFTDVGPEWHVDPYTLAPGPKTLLTVYGGEHGLGGIAGYDAAETTDEDPDMVAAVGRLTSAYLRSQLFPADGGAGDNGDDGEGSEGSDAWQLASGELATGPHAFGRVDTK
jgi:hypothetical protein